MTPPERSNTLVLRWCLLTHLQPAVLVLIKFHLPVELLSFVKDLHQFVVDLITVELFQDGLLMLKLVLRLLCLLSSLLLLNNREGIFRLLLLGSDLCIQVLAVRLGSCLNLRRI